MRFKLEPWRGGWGGWGSFAEGATISLDKTSSLNALNSQALQTQWFERSRAFGSTGVEQERM